MAKTLLFSRIQRQFREHRQARARGMPVEALRAKLSERGAQGIEFDSGRRQALLAAGGLMATAAFPKTLRAAPANADPRIAIFGAGIAGLTCALRLADRGISSTVYEASHRVGGRMFSNASGYWNEGQVSEWGGEFIDTGHATIRSLARRFHLKLDDVSAAAARGSTDTYFFDGQYYSQRDADQDFSAIFDIVLADTAAAPFPTTFDSFTPAGQTLDRMSLYDWIESRVPGGHASRLGKLLDVAYAIEYAADTADQSALNILYLLGSQPDPTGRTLALFGVSDERFHIRGGNELLPKAIAASLSPNTIRFGHRLARVSQRGAGYGLALETANGTRDVTADIVVLALPFAVLRGLDYSQAGFNALKHRAIQALGRGRSSKLQMQFNTRFWNQPGPWGISTGASDVDTGYQESWDVTRAQPGTSGIMNLFSGGSVANAMLSRGAFGSATNALVMHDARNGLARAEPVFPGITRQWNGKATQSLWQLNPLAALSYSYYRVGQYTDFGGYEKASQGMVFFCGEHTSTDFQGYMEGGAAEGKRAAREIAKLLTGA